MSEQSVKTSESSMLEGAPEKMKAWAEESEFEEEHESRFILRDGNLNDACEGVKSSWGYKNLGNCVALQAEDQQPFLINPTTKIGGTVGILYGMLFEAGKDGWHIKKADEKIEVSPVHHQYYQLTSEHKEKLEAKIKQGLAGIGQSVADLELVEHDIRKYESMANAFKALKSSDPDSMRKGNLKLKALFVDEVDHHAGGGGQGQPGRLSMSFLRNNAIMPTIVDDFMSLTSLDDLENNSRFKNLPDVEKRMLELKWRSYQDWLKMFGSAIDLRMKRLETLRNSRLETLRQYREWMRPLVARHKLIDESMEHTSGRKMMRTQFLRSQGSAVSFNFSTIWIYKHLFRSEDRMIPREFYAKDAELLNPMDSWTLSNLVFNFKHGLIADYPWITKAWVDNKIKNMGRYLLENLLYYNFYRLNVTKTNIRMASGKELEDTDFHADNFLFSRNVYAAKLLESEAKDQELEHYIDRIIGQSHTKKEPCPVGYHKRFGKYWLSSNFAHHMDAMGEYFPQIAEIPLSELKDSKGFKKFSKKQFQNLFGMEKWNDSSKFWLIEQPPEDDPSYSDIQKYLALFGLSGFGKALFKSRGPYEYNFKERIVKFYFKWSGGKFSGLNEMILKRCGFP